MAQGDLELPLFSFFCIAPKIINKAAPMNHEVYPWSDCGQSPKAMSKLRVVNVDLVFKIRANLLGKVFSLVSNIYTPELLVIVKGENKLIFFLLDSRMVGFYFRLDLSIIYVDVESKQNWGFFFGWKYCLDFPSQKAGSLLLNDWKNELNFPASHVFPSPNLKAISEETVPSY